MQAPPDKPQATEQEKALADVSAAQWTDYVERFRPAEAALIRKAELTKGERAQVKGEVAADTATAFAGLSRSTVATGQQAGANVSSGKTKLGLAGDAEAAGVARGVGQAAAETGAEVDAEQQKLRIAGFGRKVATDVTANLSRGAQRATSLALAASEARFQRNQGLIDGVSAVAGAATRKFGGDIFDRELNEVELKVRPQGGF